MSGSKPASSVQSNGAPLPPGRVGVLRRLGVEQQPVGDGHVGARPGQIVGRGDGQRLHHLTAEALARPRRRAPASRAPWSCSQSGFTASTISASAGIVHVDGQRDDLGAAGDALRPAPRRAPASRSAGSSERSRSRPCRRRRPARRPASPRSRGRRSSRSGSWGRIWHETGEESNGAGGRPETRGTAENRSGRLQPPSRRQTRTAAARSSMARADRLEQRDLVGRLAAGRRAAAEVEEVAGDVGLADARRRRAAGRCRRPPSARRRGCRHRRAPGGSPSSSASRIAGV